MSRPSIVWCVFALAALVGCSTPGGDVLNVDDNVAVINDRTTPPSGMDASGPEVFIPPSADVAALDVRRDAGPNADAFWADNPPPRFCGPDGGMSAPPTLPGGTADCPDDLLREGCPCTAIGQERPCWPGLRVHRNRGICRDGMTRCVMDNELGGRWSACEGYVLPQAGQRLGPASCQCFSQGQWEITNLSPCFITYPGNQVYAVSTYLDGMNQARCPTTPGGPPPMPQAGTNFSTNFLTIDCSGRFRLCFTIKAGDPMRPGAGDCTLSQTCTEGWYERAGTRQAMPPLPSWVSGDPVCAARFVASGGYGEMTVQGLSTECQAIDNGSGMPYAFLRVPYCPVRCSMNPMLPECAMCRNGGAGRF